MSGQEDFPAGAGLATFLAHLFIEGKALDKPNAIPKGKLDFRFISSPAIFEDLLLSSHFIFLRKPLQERDSALTAYCSCNIIIDF